jgi:hypothetical protein
MYCKEETNIPLSTGENNAENRRKTSVVEYKRGDTYTARFNCPLFPL